MLVPTRKIIPAQFTPCGHRHAHAKTRSSRQNTTSENQRLNSLQQIDSLQFPRQGITKPQGSLVGESDTDVTRMCVTECCRMSCQVSTQSNTMQLQDPVMICCGTDITMPKLCVIGDCKTTRQASARRKKVRFHPSAKKHDGISPQQANLERLVLQFFNVNRNVQLLQQLLHDRKLKQLRMLWFQVRRVILLVARSPRGRIPLLEKGGGSVVIRTKNLPQLKKLLDVTKKAYQICAALVKENR